MIFQIIRKDYNHMDSSIIVAIISLIGSFILIYLSSIKETSDRKYTVRKEQLDKFYIPFYQKYCATFLSQNKLSELDINTSGIFLDLFTNNLHLMEPESQSLYQDYYLAFLNMLEANTGNPDFPLDECSQKLDQIFSKMSKTIFNEYKQILKKCHLPVPLI